MRFKREGWVCITVEKGVRCGLIEGCVRPVEIGDVCARPVEKGVRCGLREGVCVRPV